MKKLLLSVVLLASPAHSQCLPSAPPNCVDVFPDPQPESMAQRFQGMGHQFWNSTKPPEEDVNLGTFWLEEIGFGGEGGYVYDDAKEASPK